MIKTVLRSTLLLALIFGSIVGFEEVREQSFQYTASKAHPFKIMGRTVCSSSQIEYEGKRFTLTNRHCCQALSQDNRQRRKAKNYNMVSTEGDFAVIDDTLQQVISLDDKHDLCVLTPDLSKPSFKLARSYSVGEPIHVIGHPMGMPQTIRDGRIVAVEHHIYPWVNRFHKLPMLLVSNIGYGGNSGSPVVDRFGQLVGVIFLGWNTRHTEMGAVPLENVKEFLDRVISE